MSTSEYINHAEHLLRRLEQQCDDFNDSTDADIDNQRVGGMITLIFSDRSQIVVNLQPPLREVWLASRTGGYHYRFDGQSWVDTRGGIDFWTRLSQDASTQAKTPLHFSAG